MLKSNTNPKLLFILTGSIALYKVMNVLSHFKKQNYDLEVVATDSALKFVGVSTIEGLTGKKVHSDLYANGSNMDHINLVRWADAIVVAPATANYLNKLASGIADDLASTLFLAHDFTKPWAVFPAMNTKMYKHPSTKQSINMELCRQAIASAEAQIGLEGYTMASDDHREAIIAFIEKRKPVFTGR